MKARLTALTAVTALSMSVLASAAAAEPAPEQTTARAKASKLAWAYVSSGQPKKSFSQKKGAVPVGRSGKAVYRAYYRIDLSDAMSEDVVSSVRLRVPVKAPNACRRGGAPAVRVQQTRTVPARPTWKKQPKVVRTLGTFKPKCSGKALDLNLTKAALRVLDQGGDNLSIRLVATDEKKAKNFLKLSHSARLTIRAYSNNNDDDGGAFGDPGANAPQAVGGASFNNGGCAVGPDRPEIEVGNAAFSGTVADADGGFVGLRVEWETVGENGTQDSKMQFSNPGEGRNLTVALPAGTFKKDGVYRWRLQGFDDVPARSGPWTDWCEFAVDLPAAPEPAAPEPAAPEPVVPPVPAAGDEAKPA
ncbi:DNRLRE domain-containing protein [Actinocorallia sp. B10E7]|uniref:DNRLRE domain-containing protein n=1 Tax=Actinocorallia sp. B10E7 TaxID=3153558 RepID=UPI00325EA33F